MPVQATIGCRALALAMRYGLSAWRSAAMVSIKAPGLVGLPKPQNPQPGPLFGWPAAYRITLVFGTCRGRVDVWCQASWDLEAPDIPEEMHAVLALLTTR
ncbi:hypothetical protein E5D57_002676 [Metarhizium anisopliae]|nr:hypothetical protein E5D57_002676 [Metarhizium anisopliae]